MPPTRKKSKRVTVHHDYSVSFFMPDSREWFRLPIRDVCRNPVIMPNLHPTDQQRILGAMKELDSAA